MKNTKFYVDKLTEIAFVAKRAKDFNLLVASQAESIYQERGMIFPVSVSSTLLFISRNAPVSQAELSRSLDQPHQLVAYRVRELENLKLIQRKIDPKDNRRKLLRLTKKGCSQAKSLEEFSKLAVGTFEDLFEEIGVDLSDGLGKAIEALKAVPLYSRFSQEV